MNNNMEIKLKLTIPYGKPNRNDIICTESAIEDALKNSKPIPITLQENPSDYPHPIGHTSFKSYFAEWDDENQVCRVTVNGKLYNVGPEIVVKEMENGKITSFEIKSIGICE